MRSWSGPGLGHQPPILCVNPCGLGVRSDDRAADCKPLQIGILDQSLENIPQSIARYPVIIASLDRLIIAITFWQIPLPAARTRQPQKSIDKKPVVCTRPALALTSPRHQRRKPFPLPIRQHPFAPWPISQKTALNHFLCQMGIHNP
jgi:hypothetical protein